MLDIWAFGSSDVSDLLIDVTIKHPMAAAYASHDAAIAAAAGERSKLKRYPAAQGRAVTPFAVETWGRLGTHAEEALQKMVAAATRHNVLRGHAPAPGSLLKRWRASLDAGQLGSADQADNTVEAGRAQQLAVLSLWSERCAYAVFMFWVALFFQLMWSWPERVCITSLVVYVFGH